jgi:hypothetical protein
LIERTKARHPGPTSSDSTHVSGRGHDALSNHLAFEDVVPRMAVGQG